LKPSRQSLTQAVERLAIKWLRPELTVDRHFGERTAMEMIVGDVLPWRREPLGAAIDLGSAHVTASPARTVFRLDA
jgi:hypothetical protein